MEDFVRSGGLRVSTSTPYGKELAKWEQPHYRPEAHPYPKMMYKAFTGSDGVHRCMDTPPPEYLYRDGLMDQYRMALEKVKNFNDQCTRTVQNEEEERAARGEGWRESSAEAIQFLKDLQTDILQAAAEMEYQDRNMGEKAKAEADAFKASTPFIPTSIPEAPKRRRSA